MSNKFMIHHKKSYIIFILLLSFFSVKAQQDPQYTQYMYNMSVVNPAYSTDDTDIINIGGLYRAQWVGSVGGPTTGNLFVHSPIAEKQEMGVSVVHDEIGNIVKQTNFYVDYAYKINIGETSKLAFGVKAGATFFDTNFNGFQYSSSNPDPAFANNLNQTFPNLGFGTYYFGEQYYVGLSAPNLLTTKQLEKQDGVLATGVEEIHYFFTGGYVFNLSDDFKFKPAFMAKCVKGSPLSTDLTANFLMHEKLELGVGYRWDDSVSSLISFRVSPSMRIGYAYDYTLTNLSSFNSGSHEFMLLFDLSKSSMQKDGKGFDKSPRFF